jgi:hypothetical protein
MLEMRLAATIQALRTTATGLIDMAYADEDLASLTFFGFSPSFL